jgi:hypothetical protein
MRVTGVAGFLLAKVAAAHARRKPKDWYDVAFVLLHNDEGGVDGAVARVRDVVDAADLRIIETALLDLRANFADASAQGSTAYAAQFELDHPGEDRRLLAGDAILAVQRFCGALLGG